MSREDYYSLLGVDRHAPEREIKRAYYNLARDLHPDKAKSPEEARLNSERLGVISKAYNTLKDPQKRETYDSSLKDGGPRAAASPAKVAPDPSTDSGRGSAPQPDPATGSAVAPPAPVSRLSASDMQSQKVLIAQKAFVRGMQVFKNQEYKKAIPFFEAAVENDPESEPHYHVKLAVSLMRTKTGFSKAIAAAEAACKMDNYNMDFKFILGEVYETFGVMTKAMEVYEDILKWEPENEKARLKLSLLKSIHNQQNASFLAKMLPSIFGKK